MRSREQRLINVLLPTATFKPEAAYCASNVQLVQDYLCLLWPELTTHFATKATPIDSIDGKCHATKLKSSRTCLTSYFSFISHE